MPLTSPIRCRVGQVFIPVNDMPAAIAWYARLFGFEPGDPSHAGGIYDLPVEGDTLLVLDAHKPVTSTSVQPICMFPTDDMDAALVHLRSVGAEITSEPQDIGSLVFAIFRDPDGNPLMIYQPK
ncbi:MAG TPA: VOC family protein [Thermomicrobiales bacterium]|nr:VOC family protein [Thermomicrobiales bacterium]